jgi:hypothetical protein
VDKRFIYYPQLRKYYYFCIQQLMPMNSNKEISWFEERKEQIHKELQSHPLYIELEAIEKALSYYHKSHKTASVPKQHTPAPTLEGVARTLRELILDELEGVDLSKKEIVNQLKSLFHQKTDKQLNNVVGPKLTELIKSKEIIVVQKRAPTKGGNIYGLAKK